MFTDLVFALSDFTKEFVLVDVKASLALTEVSRSKSIIMNYKNLSYLRYLLIKFSTHVIEEF
jgi:hypothetical protein